MHLACEKGMFLSMVRHGKKGQRNLDNLIKVFTLLSVIGKTALTIFSLILFTHNIDSSMNDHWLIFFCSKKCSFNLVHYTEKFVRP